MRFKENVQICVCACVQRPMLLLCVEAVVLQKRMHEGFSLLTRCLRLWPVGETICAGRPVTPAPPPPTHVF